MIARSIIPDLCSDIRQELGVLAKNHRYALLLSNQHQGRLHQLANLYSWWLEHPEVYNLEMAREDPKGLERNIRKLSRIGRRKMKDAWALLSNSPVLPSLDHHLLLGVGKIIDSRNDAYRNVRVSLGLAKYVPPNPLKVNELVSEMIVRAKEIPDPIEASFYLHLRIAGIQPFIDGNKRVGRIIQNRILYEDHLPPPTISPSERGHYINCLEDALAGYQEGNSRPIRSFYEFLASKIKRHLDEALYTLS